MFSGRDFRGCRARIARTKWGPGTLRLLPFLMPDFIKTLFTPMVITWDNVFALLNTNRGLWFRRHEIPEVITYSNGFFINPNPFATDFCNFIRYYPLQRIDLFSLVFYSELITHNVSSLSFIICIAEMHNCSWKRDSRLLFHDCLPLIRLHETKVPHFE